MHCNRNFRPLFHYISELIQDTAITIEGKLETVPKLSNGTIFIDPE